MHQLRRPHDPAAEHLADGLVAEADAEHGHHPGEGLDARAGDAGVFGPARARGEQHGVGRGRRLVDRERVVAVHDRLGAQLTQVLDEVVDEAVVVVDHEHAHGASVTGQFERHTPVTSTSTSVDFSEYRQSCPVLDNVTCALLATVAPPV